MIPQKKTALKYITKNDADHWTRRENPDKISAMDITGEWIRERLTKGTVVERQGYTVSGVTYKVDGKHVILHPTKQEREVAAILSGKYGKHVEEIETQIESLYISPRVGFLEKVVLMKKGEVLKVYGRK